MKKIKDLHINIQFFFFFFHSHCIKCIVGRQAGIGMKERQHFVMDGWTIEEAVLCLLNDHHAHSKLCMHAYALCNDFDILSCTGIAMKRSEKIRFFFLCVIQERVKHYQLQQQAILM